MRSRRWHSRWRLSNGFDGRLLASRWRGRHDQAMPFLRFSVVMFLACCGVAIAAEPVTGYPTPEGAVVLSDPAGSLLELAPVGWGPNWGWCGWKTELHATGESTAMVLTTAMGPAKVPVRIDLTVAPAGPHRLAVTAALVAERDVDCTMIIVSLNPGARFRHAGAVTVMAGATTTARDVPFGKEPLGGAVTALRLGAGDDAVAVTFAAPTEIAADGVGRIVLGAGKLAGGARRALAFTVDVPGALTWFPLPGSVPDPAGFAAWFPWKPDNAVDDQGALGMKGWLDTVNAPVHSDGERLLVGDRAEKFWGLNLTYGSTAPAKELAVQRAKLYAKYGFNAVRLHKYADGPGWAGIQSATSFAEFDPAALDRFDWQVAKLKEQGIRIKLSPTFGIQLGRDDVAAVPWFTEFGQLDSKQSNARVRAAHGTVWFVRELQDLQIRQTTNLLKHRNPYTGLTYAEDPVVLVVEMYNEDSALFFGTMGQLQKVPTIRKRASEAFSDWLIARYKDDAGLKAAWGEGGLNSFRAEGFTGESLAARSVVPAGNPWFYDPDQLAGSQKPKAARLLDTMSFLHDTQNALWERFSAALRTAGYHGEVLASNWIAGRGFSHFYNLHSDALVGMVDRHNYFGGTGSMLTTAGSGILSSGLCQVAGRPFSLSEWITTRPNEFGVEGPAIIGAYGMGLQGWDVSFQFENGDDGKFRTLIGKDEWDVMAPQLLGLQPLIARQVRRGDVSESTVVAPLRVHVPSLANGVLGFSDQAAAQGDVKSADSSAVPARALAVARCVVDFTAQAQPTPAFDLAPYAKDGALVSSTGQLRWYEGSAPATGCFTIDAPATKAVVGFAAGRRFALGGVSIASQTPFAAIYLTAAERTDHDLATAKHILIGAVARARNTGMKIMDGRVLVSGVSPVLMEPVRAEIELPAGRTYVIRPLDQDGRRTAATRPVTAGRVTIDSAADKTIYWELSAE